MSPHHTRAKGQINITMQCILGWRCSPVEYVEQFDGEGGVDPESAAGPGVIEEGVDGLETEHDGL